MKGAWLILLTVAALILPACASRHVVSDLDFANKMVREGLWKEAVYRYQLALAGGTDTAALHNNLAVALENLGRWDEAEAEYQKALKLAPQNTYIQNNYTQLKKVRGKT